MRDIKKTNKETAPKSPPQTAVKQGNITRKKTLQNLKNHLGSGFTRFFNN